MGRAERRRAEREQRRKVGAGTGQGDGAWRPPTGQFRTAQFLTSPDDVARAASFAGAIEASIVLGIGTSPGIRYLMDVNGW